MFAVLKGEKMIRQGLLCLLLAASAGLISGCGAGTKSDADSSMRLWYDEPAQEWTDALPLGNGRIGAMVFGGVKKDRIQFNEETLWTGGPRDYNKKNAVQYLPKIRQLIFDGKQDEAEALAAKHFMGKKSHIDSYDRLQKQWIKKMRQDKYLKPLQPDYYDSDWKEMDIPTRNGFEREIKSLEAINGAFWFRTTITIPDDWAGQDIVLDMGKIRDMDFTYVNGQFIVSRNTKDIVRKYTVPASVLHEGQNVIAIQVLNFNDKAGLVGYWDKSEHMTFYPKEERDKGKSLEKPWKYMVQDNDPPAYPHFQAAYQPFGDLWLTFPGSDSVSHYKRSLDISKAVSKTTYEQNGINYMREYFISASAQAMVVHLSADQSGAINFKANLTSKHDSSSVRPIDDHTLALKVHVKNGALNGESRLRVDANSGEINISDDGISVQNADEATLYLVAGTNFVSYEDVSGDPSAACVKALDLLSGKSYSEVKENHIKDYQFYFNKFSINLEDAHSPNEDLPTDERIEKFDTDNDLSLIELYTQYARYLLLSSSRPGTYPPNLQGIWNDKLSPPWESKYTTNINLEMNYWSAEVLNLPSLHQPLFKMAQELAESGRETAKEYYGARGWVLHHNTDIWRGTAAIDASNHGVWVTGGAWICHQLWDHFRFTQDTTFLKNTAYPVMKSASKFFDDFLIKDSQTGWLISTPSNSPEHGGLVAGPTMDHQIIRDLFKNTMAAGEILKTDKAFRDTLQRKYNQLAPNQIGQYGQLQEWLEDKDDPNDHHRHVSHLWGVYPGTDITWDTPKMMKAARKSLKMRGDEGTGWSLAWKINLWDRFKNGDHAFELVKRILSPAEAPGREERGGSYNNLFDAHPPFQIDGNFGGAAGIAGMLIQSYTETIELLPALPSELPEGEVHGLRARGDFSVDLEWTEGKLKHVRVHSLAGKKCTLQYGDKTINFDTKKGKVYNFDGKLNR